MVIFIDQVKQVMMMMMIKWGDTEKNTRVM